MIDIFDTGDEPEPPEVEILFRANEAPNSSRLIELFHTARRRGFPVEEALENTLNGKAGRRTVENDESLFTAE